VFCVSRALSILAVVATIRGLSTFLLKSNIRTLPKFKAVNRATVQQTETELQWCGLRMRTLWRFCVYIKCYKPVKHNAF
jgi:hypothetical protein